MDIRVLTLFDDDDFLPQEEPKKTAKKTAAGKGVQPGEKAQEHQEIKESITDTPTELPVLPGTPVDNSPAMEPVIMADTPETAMIPAEEGAATAPSIPGQDAPEAIQEEPSQAFRMEEAEGEPAHEVTEASMPLQEEEMTVAAAEEALNKQLLTELIQTDYAALIHKEYPFDLQQASVVKKDKPARAAQPAHTAGEPEADQEVFEEVVPLPEWNLDKKYYTIGEVAQLFAVNTSHIRFWTNEFKLKPRTTRKGDRLYSPADIAELRLIHHLVKEKKHTIKGAREKLKAEKSGVNNKLDLKDSLTQLKDMLIQIREQL